MSRTKTELTVKGFDQDNVFMLAEIVADARRKRRQPRVVGALIAATAVAHGLPLYSQDRDFGLMPRVELILV